MATQVLIVDDHASFRRLASRVLARAGFEIVGEAARRLARAQSYT